MAFTQLLWWRCKFCSATVFYNTVLGETESTVVERHFKCCRVLAPLILEAALQLARHHIRKERKEDVRKRTTN